MKKIHFFLFKNLLCISLFLGLGIICKLDISCKSNIQRKLYQDYLDFSTIKGFYDRYLGGIFPIDNISSNNVKSVFNEELFYQEALKYKDGVMLKVNYNYIVPAISGGLVVYIGEKDNYGNVVIVEGNNGVDVWYGNLCNVMVKIYDVVDKGSYLGEVCDDKLYVVYTKKNEFLNYVDYLK